MVFGACAHERSRIMCCILIYATSGLCDVISKHEIHGERIFFIGIYVVRSISSCAFRQDRYTLVV